MSNNIKIENVIKFYDPVKNPHQREAILLLQEQLDKLGLTNPEVAWVKKYRTPNPVPASNNNVISYDSFYNYLDSIPVNKSRLTKDFPIWHKKVINYFNKFNLESNVYKTVYSHFWSQCLVETDAFHGLIEYGNYDYFRPYANHPSLGNEGSEELAFRYRGAGLTHTTGKYNYTKLSKAMNDPHILTEGAIYVANNYAVESATFFWDSVQMIERVIKPSVNRSLREQCEVVTRTVNGGLNHFQQRFNYFVDILKIV